MGTGRKGLNLPICSFSFSVIFFFAALTWLLLTYNIRKVTTQVFRQRFIYTFLIAGVAYGLYVMISLMLNHHVDCFTGMLLFQFVVTFLLCVLTGHIYALFTYQRKKEQEIEQLKLENLQSRCEALANQINPHFFFNSLNSLTYLIREGEKEHTLAYVNKLSEVFRYILQSDKKGLVTLREELDFLKAFRFLFEVRYANKLMFDIVVDPDKYNRKLPVLSLLPLVENVVKHNVIDSENRMTVTVRMNEQDELAVSNPVHEKFDVSTSCGIGLSNLQSRFVLQMEMKIRIEEKDGIFTVYLPLKK
ncbi:MAG: histidine kinase [Tannerellaceae bacterium]|nr:histidine kinase [Tannerellaceae bacterium]